jgi:two-component system chemotaxis sensor kinase CheA
VASALAGVDEMPSPEPLLARLRGAAAGEAPAAAGEIAAAALDAGAERSASQRVSARKLDRLLAVVGEIAIARGRLRGLLRAAGAPAAAAAEADEEGDRHYEELHRLAMELRAVPVAGTFRPVRRVVRELAASVGKDVALELEGAATEADAALLERLREPLLHMVRNAVDHGIEGPEERRAAGKPERGTVWLRAAHEPGTLRIEVADDGAGLDAERILERARQAGLVAPGETPTPEAVRQLVFEGGLSTADRVTHLSGRGVGMDVVRTQVQALRGTVHAASTPGGGTTFTLRLPLSLAIIDGFHVGVGDETYVLPLDAVRECHALPAGEDHPGRSAGVLQVHGAPLPWIRLRRWFGVQGDPARRECVVVISHEEGRAGLVVDALHGEAQTVVRPLAAQLRSARWLSGATVLGDGRVGLLLDTRELLRSAHASGAAAAPSAPSSLSA